MFGFININKPKGITSHDVIYRLRKATKIKQIGHAGTLDPLAQGVLPVAVGKATRLIEYLSDEKGYCVTFEFGKISDTYDTEGTIEKFSDILVTRENLENILCEFVGNITQIPPAYSAVHYNGKRLYELAREGLIPEDIPKRIVTVEKVEILSFDEISQKCVMDINCSKGTYIRSIVHDIGQRLGSGAVMTDLVRTKSSNFKINSAVELEKLQTSLDVGSVLINPLEVLSFNKIQLSDDEFSKVKNGNPFPAQDDLGEAELMLEYNNKLVAIATATENIIKIDKVFV